MYACHGCQPHNILLYDGGGCVSRGPGHHAYYNTVTSYFGRMPFTGVDLGFSEGGGGANDGKGEWGVPPPTQSREAFAIIVCD